MSKTFRIIDLRSTVIDAVERTVEANSPEAAVDHAMGLDTVRSGARKDLVARVYWQLSPSEPTNMVRLYRRLDPERAMERLARDKHEPQG
nr:hypothetical protein [uncultured Devosia sp.]